MIMKEIEGKKVWIFRSEQPSRTNQISVHMDPGIVLNEFHILSAVKQALRAMANGSNIAKKEELEILLRVTGLKQISKAVKYSVDKGECLVVEVGPEKPKAKEKEPAISPDMARIKKLFGGTEEAEVIEKVALLNLS